MVYALIDHKSGAKMLKTQGEPLQSLTILTSFIWPFFQFLISISGEGAGKKHARKKKKK